METGSEQYTWYSGEWRKANRKFPPYNGVKISYVPVYDEETGALDHLEVTVIDRTSSDIGIQRQVHVGLANGWMAIEPESPRENEQYAPMLKHKDSRPTLPSTANKVAQPSGKESTAATDDKPVAHSVVANDQDAAPTAKPSIQLPALLMPPASAATAAEAMVEDKTQQASEKDLSVVETSVASPPKESSTKPTVAEDIAAHEAVTTETTTSTATDSKADAADKVDTANMQNASATNKTQVATEAKAASAETLVADESATTQNQDSSDTATPIVTVVSSQPESAASASKPTAAASQSKPATTPSQPKPKTAPSKPMTVITAPKTMGTPRSLATSAASKPMATPKPTAAPPTDATAKQATVETKKTSMQAKPTFWRRLRLSSKLLFAKQSDLKHLHAEFHSLAMSATAPETQTEAIQSDTQAKQDTEPAQQHNVGHVLLTPEEKAAGINTPSRITSTDLPSSFTVLGHLRLRESSNWVLLGVRFSYGLETQRRQALGFIGKVPAVRSE